MSLFEITPFDAPGGQRKRDNKLSLTVSERSVIVPAGTWKAWGSPKFVEVGFNAKAKIFAVKPVEKPSKLSIMVMDGKHTKAIGRTRVCEQIEKLRNFGRKTNNLILVDGWFDEASGYFMFDLDKGQIVLRGRRGKPIN